MNKILAKYLDATIEERFQFWLEIDRHYRGKRKKYGAGLFNIYLSLMQRIEEIEQSNVKVEGTGD